MTWTRMLAAGAAAAAMAFPASASAGVIGGGAIFVGSGQTQIGTTFSFFGQIVPSGAFGTADFANPSLPASLANRTGPIVCAKIDGNRVTFGVQTSPTAWHLFTAQDLGNNPSDPTDRIRGSVPLSVQPQCTRVGHVTSRYEIESGDIVIAADPITT